MANPFGIKPGSRFTSEHFLSGWCPECGLRRGADSRCKNCDPWWTSPLVQAGIPVLLGAFFVLTTASALLKQFQPSASAAAVNAGARLITVTVKRDPPIIRQETVSVSKEVPAAVMPPELTGPAIRIQREGAYINAVLKAQDESRRAQEIAARNQAMALALQQRIQTTAITTATPTPQPQSSPAAPVAHSDAGIGATTPLEKAVIEENTVVPQ